MTVFDRAWDVVKTPLDYDSIDPFLLDNIGTEKSVYQPKVDEHGFRIDPWEKDPKTQIAVFIHPETGEKYPIQITTPSLSHDFNLEMLYPDDAPRSWDGMLSREQAAMVNVGYPNEEPPTQELMDDFRMRYPPKGTQVEVHPYVTQDNRRQGMATALYDLVERLGYPIRQADTLSDDGEAFWANRRLRE